MTPEQLAVLRELHNAGYAICVFTPEELDKAEQEIVEDAMAVAGWGEINFAEEN